MTTTTTTTTTRTTTRITLFGSACMTSTKRFSIMGHYWFVGSSSSSLCFFQHHWRWWRTYPTTTPTLFVSGGGDPVVVVMMMMMMMPWKRNHYLKARPSCLAEEYFPMRVMAADNTGVNIKDTFGLSSSLAAAKATAAMARTKTMTTTTTNYHHHHHHYYYHRHYPVVGIGMGNGCLDPVVLVRSAAQWPSSSHTIPKSGWSLLPSSSSSSSSHHHPPRSWWWPLGTNTSSSTTTRRPLGARWACLTTTVATTTACGKRYLHTTRSSSSSSSSSSSDETTNGTTTNRKVVDPAVETEHNGGDTEVGIPFKNGVEALPDNSLRAAATTSSTTTRQPQLLLVDNHKNDHKNNNNQRSSSNDNNDNDQNITSIQQPTNNKNNNQNNNRSTNTTKTTTPTWNYQYKKKKKKTNDFVTSWWQLKDRLLNRPLGSFESHHWMQAEQLLTRLRTHTAFIVVEEDDNDDSGTIQKNPAPQQQQQQRRRVYAMLQILDRLWHEVVVLQQRQQQQQQGRRPTNHVAPVRLPLEGALWTTVLVCWRDYYLSSAMATTRTKTTTTMTKPPLLPPPPKIPSNHHSTSTPQQEKQPQSQQEPHPQPQHELDSAGDDVVVPTTAEEEDDFLSFHAMWQRVERYMDVGLFPPDSVPYNILLHVSSQVHANHNNSNNNYNSSKGHSPPPPPHLLLSKSQSPLQPQHEQQQQQQAAARLGEAIVQQMLQKATTTTTTTTAASSSPQKYYYFHVHPTATTIYHVVQLWAHCAIPHVSAQRAEYFLDLLQQWYHDAQQQQLQQQQQQQYSQHAQLLRPTPNLYCAVMEAHSRSSPPHVALPRIQELWIQLKNQQQQQHEQEQNPSAIMATTTKRRQRRAAKDNEHDDNVLDSKIYNRVCHAMGLCRHPEAPDAARAVLDELLGLYHSFSIRNVDAPNDRCLQQQQQQQRREELERFQPTTHIYSSVISAYGRAGRVQEAQALMDALRYQGQTNDALRPNVVAYSALIWAYAHAKDAVGAESVLSQMMQDMQQSHAHNGNKNDSWHAQVNAQTWNGILVSWAQSGDPQATERMTLLLDRLETVDLQQQQQQQQQQLGVKPWVTVDSYNILLSCHAAQQPKENAVKGALAAEALVQWMETRSDSHQYRQLRPNGDTYMNLLLAWRNAGDPQRCQALLDQFLLKVKKGLLDKSCIDQRHFSIVVDAWANSNNPQAAHNAQAIVDNMMIPLGVRPETVCYTSLLWAWARSTGKTDPAVPMERIYQQMLHQWQNQGDVYAAPNSLTLNALCFGLSQSSDPTALERAHQYLADLQHHMGGRMANVVKLPSLPISNTLMAAWSKRHRPDRVELLFQELQTAFDHTRDSDFKPDLWSFTSRLHAWSKVGNAKQTTRVLQEWIAEAETPTTARTPTTMTMTTKESFHPGTQAFNAVLHAWALNNRPDAAERGLRQMIAYAQAQRFDCAPDKISYTMVISAYAGAAWKANHRTFVVDNEGDDKGGVEDDCTASNSKHDGLSPKTPTAGAHALRLLNELKEAAKKQQQEQLKVSAKLTLEPDFVTYSQVIVALLRSSTSHSSSNNGGASTVDMDTIRPIHQLFQELQSKEPSFWTQGDKKRTDMLFEKIRQTIRNCGIPASLAHDLLSEWNGLELQVRAKMNSRPI